MELILYTREEMDATLAHGAFLCTPEQADEYYLMHWRTKGSKNGIRRYQDESGRLTPEGYKHYAEMYGWNKRLNKISRLQDKADRLTNKAAKADVKAAKAKVKSDKAERDANAITRRAILNPGQDRNSEMDNAVLDVARMENLKYQNKQNKADSLHGKADRANQEAVKLADKLQRKEAKMQKYVNEDGSLNDKALEKYTKEAGENGERKMSLRGRMKFGNEYSDKFDKDSSEKAANAVREAAEKAQKLMDKRMGEYDSLPEGSQERKASLDQVHSYLEDMKAGRLKVDSKTYENLNAWYEKKTGDEKREISQLRDRLPEYDSMSEKDKARVGNRVLEELAAMTTRNYRQDGEEYGSMMMDLQTWLVDRVYEKAGSMNASEYKPGTNALRAQEKADTTFMERDEREAQIRKENGFPEPYTGSYSKSKYDQIKRDEERLQKLLQKDSTWKKLDVQLNKDYDEVNGAILKDLGFPDTPRNRSILYRFGWWD